MSTLYREFTIRSVGELLSFVVTEQDAVNANANRKSLWFRGHSNARFELIPSVFRDVPQAGRLDLERHLVHRFRARAAMHLQEAVGYDDRARWLAIMQHHRLPTRLLDWSRSPLVAGFFAAEAYLPNFFLSDSVSAPMDDAALWVLDPFDLNALTLSHKAATDGSDDANDRDRGGIVGALESKVIESLVTEAFYPYQPPLGRLKSTQIEPPIHAAYSVETDIRMFVQRGCFTIHGHELGPMESESALAPLLTKLVIPAKDLPGFAHEVAASGFAEADIYPDLDHLASEMVRTSPLPYARRAARKA